VTARSMSCLTVRPPRNARAKCFTSSTPIWVGWIDVFHFGPGYREGLIDVFHFGPGYREGWTDVFHFGPGYREGWTNVFHFECRILPFDCMAVEAPVSGFSYQGNGSSLSLQWVAAKAGAIYDPEVVEVLGVLAIPKLRCIG